MKKFKKILKLNRMVIVSLLLLFCIFSCKKTLIDPSSPIVLEGGKGGDYSIAVFSKLNKKGQASRIFIKYAANKHPLDTNLFDEKSNTITEPGFGPHVHFNNLKEGSYYIWCNTVIGSANYWGDTILIINTKSLKSSDFSVNIYEH